jgi:LPXTG-motif cell wall-anchored protein
MWGIMNLFRVLGIASVVVGVFLLVFGIRATNKVPEQVVEKVTGHYSSNTMWYIIGGVVLIVVGGGLIVKRQR